MTPTPADASFCHLPMTELTVDTQVSYDTRCHLPSELSIDTQNSLILAVGGVGSISGSVHQFVSMVR